MNVDTGTTLIRNAKFLKHVPSKNVGNDINVDTRAKTEEYNDSSTKTSDVFKSTELPGRIVEQASQSKQVITTRSRRVLKSKRGCDNFVYY